MFSSLALYDLHLSLTFCTYVFKAGLHFHIIIIILCCCCLFSLALFCILPFPFYLTFLKKMTLQMICFALRKTVRWESEYQ